MSRERLTAVALVTLMTTGMKLYSAYIHRTYTANSMAAETVDGFQLEKVSASDLVAVMFLYIVKYGNLTRQKLYLQI